MTFFLYIVFYILLVGVGICIGILWEQSMSRRYAEDIVYNCDDFCFNHCKIHEEVYSQFKDPDDAWKELDGGHYCEKCPILFAQDIVDDERLEKWKKKKGKKK